MGRTDLAAAVAAQDSFPSHGYWSASGAGLCDPRNVHILANPPCRIVNGGTTCWENWSGDADDQHPPPPTHDHIFLCSSTYWFYTTLLGIRQPPMAGSLISVGFAAVRLSGRGGGGSLTLPLQTTAAWALRAGHPGPAAHRQPAVHGRLCAHCARQLRPLLGVDWPPHGQHDEAQRVGPCELARYRHGPRSRPRVTRCDRERRRGVGERDIPTGSGDPLCCGRRCRLHRLLSRVGRLCVLHV